MIGTSPARKAAQTTSATVRLGSDPAAEKGHQRAGLSIADLIDAFLAGYVAKLKAKSRSAYAESLNKLRAAHGAVKAESLARYQVAALHRSMVKAPYAANRMLAVISSLFNWAERNNLVPEGHANPAAKIERYREQARERFLTGDGSPGLVMHCGRRQLIPTRSLRFEC